MHRLVLIALHAALVSAAAAQPATQPQRDERQPGPKPQSATPPGWTQLSLATAGVDRFLAQHPQADGRGVVIAILDTGVDPSIPGLTKLPDGGVKVIDVQDFTGDGDVELERVRFDAEKSRLIRPNEDGDPIEFTPPPVPAAPAGAERRWWFGELAESRFLASDQADLNGDDDTDDTFPVLVTALAEEGDDQALVFVDTNLDRSFAEEKALRNYKLNFDLLQFPREKPEAQIVPLTLAVNVELRQSKVVFHVDNGGHGTHVAGIAAGYQINNQPGFNGVAPGAKLMSLKIGHGGLGGISVTGSIEQALRYAARYAQQNNVPVVCNLSYGVESEIEGQSEIDRTIDEILQANPNVTFCTSAGNSGPGLSTVGTPAAAAHAITVGALMAADTGRDVAGYTLAHPVVTTFSSRGGELAKPDIATPGWSTSTVPRFVREGDFWAGTSMASPYAAGMSALLVSYAQQGDVPLPPRSTDIRRALAIAASPLPGFTALDQGYGVPNMLQAAAALTAILGTGQPDPLFSYEITTASPLGHKGKAPAAFWRATWFPKDDRQTFTIEPVFAPTTDLAQRTAFSRRYELRSLTPWCKLPQQTVYLRGEQNTRVFVEYDAAQLTEPGLHVGVVEALTDGLVAFRLINTVVVPYEFTAAEMHMRTWAQRSVRGWVPDRYFVAVPPGASAMKIVLAAPEGTQSRAGVSSIFDPHGAGHAGGRRLDAANGLREVEWTLADELIPGVWEIPVVADRPDKEWPYDLRVQFFGLHANPARITTGSSAKPAGELTVTNMFEQPVAASADGQLEGFRQHKEDKFTGKDNELKYSVTVDERVNRLRLKLEMTPEDYATTTDIAVLVRAGDDEEPIYKSAFENRLHEATFSTDGKKKLDVIIHAGFATADEDRKVPITVNIDQLFSSPVSIQVNQDGEASLTFVPGLPLKLDYKTGEKVENIPSGWGTVGFLRFRERASNDLLLRVPLHVGG